MIKTNLIKLICGLAMLGMAATGMAQSTWNYYISDAGDGFSLVTWTVTGSLTTSTGSVYTSAGGFGGVYVMAPGIFADDYTGSQGTQNITIHDDSYFYTTELDQDFPIILYYTYNASGSDNDAFLLLSYSTATEGQHVIYNAGTESALIPISFSEFNPGTYQTVLAAGTLFDTATTVNLTVGAVPEPSTLALFALGGLGGVFLCRRRKQSI